MTTSTPSIDYEPTTVGSNCRVSERLLDLLKHIHKIFLEDGSLEDRLRSTAPKLHAE